MSPAFSIDDKERIRESILASAESAFAKMGIKRTRIEDIARTAGIAKGTFYLFYSSKEILFFELLERIETTERAPIANKLRAAGKLNFENFVEEEIAALERHPFLLTALRGDDISYLFRKIPAERIAAHMSKDREYLGALCAEMRASKGLAGDAGAETYMKALMAIFIAALNPDMTGPGMAESLRLLGRGLDRMLEEEARAGR